MANEKPPSSRRRRPPVIDLQATEVPPEQPAPAEAAAPADPPPQPEAAPPPPPSPDPPPRAEAEPQPERHTAFAGPPKNSSWSHASAGLTGAAAALLVALLLWLAGAFSGGRDASSDF